MVCVTRALLMIESIFSVLKICSPRPTSWNEIDVGRMFTHPYYCRHSHYHGRIYQHQVVRRRSD